MSSEEARKLLGGYATGSLTEAERDALFQAALKDQDLFDELAGEQGLKEVLDEPGARQRLLVALEPPKRHRAWLWAGAAATAAIAVVIGIVVSPRTPPPPQQIAQVLKSAEPAEAPIAAPVPVPPPVPKPASPKVAPAPPPPPVAESLKDLQKAESENRVAEQVQPSQPLVAPQTARQAAPLAATGAVSQFAAAARVASVFGFNYAVGADGFLVITPTAFGFLYVTADDMVISPSAAVNAGTPVRIAIPSNAASLVIAFSMMPGISGAPVRRDGTTGTVTDQDPPNGKILIQLSLTPGTR